MWISRRHFYRQFCEVHSLHIYLFSFVLGAWRRREEDVYRRDFPPKIIFPQRMASFLYIIRTFENPSSSRCCSCVKQIYVVIWIIQSIHFARSHVDREILGVMTKCRHPFLEKKKTKEWLMKASFMPPSVALIRALDLRLRGSRMRFHLEGFSDGAGYAGCFL